MAWGEIALEAAGGIGREAGGGRGMWGGMIGGGGDAGSIKT